MLSKIILLVILVSQCTHSLRLRCPLEWIKISAESEIPPDSVISNAESNAAKIEYVIKANSLQGNPDILHLGRMDNVSRNLIVTIPKFHNNSPICPCQ